MCVYIYSLLFGSRDHIHGDVFHTVPGKKLRISASLGCVCFGVFKMCLQKLPFCSLFLLSFG